MEAWLHVVATVAGVGISRQAAFQPRLVAEVDGRLSATVDDTQPLPVVLGVFV